MTIIEVFADVACPFTHVGMRRFVERREALGRNDVRLHVRAWPLEWVNGVPMDAHHIAEEIDALRAQVSPDLFVRFTEAAFPASSLPAMRLAAAAYTHGIEVGEAVSLALRWALFEDGLDISKPDVLRAIAGQHGVGEWATEDVVRTEYESGKARGVIGSPHFFVGELSQFCPLLSITKVSDGWIITQDLSTLDQLLTRPA